MSGPFDAGTEPTATALARYPDAFGEFEVTPEPPARPLNFFEHALIGHTCSFGEECRLKVRARQLGVQS